MLATVASFAHDGKHDGLPLGDNKISREPTRGFVMACNTRFAGGGGAHRVGEWIKDGRWFPEQKPVVEGNVKWPNSRITVTVEGGERVVRSNNLPTHETGEFPVHAGSKAYQYDRNPNAITAQEVLLRLPAKPTIAKDAQCVPMGMIGFALSGTALFNAFDLAGRDAPAYEVQDRCNGHPEPGGSYHYHHWSDCITDAAKPISGTTRQHSDLIGFMLDGFPIYGLRGENGKALTNADLDACHGHTHEVMLDGKPTTTYHYHFTHEYPYTIGCFRGAVDQRLVRQGPPSRPPPR